MSNYEFQTLVNKKTEDFSSANATQNKVELNWCDYESEVIAEYQLSNNTPEFLSDNIPENRHFSYPVFTFLGEPGDKRAILLLHGLNERNWDKYYSWGAALCEKTKRPVILFPLAYHMNRSPKSWSNPRCLESIYAIRKTKLGNDRSISYANMALSYRLWEKPERFYHSGKQSLSDITSLVKCIIQGSHAVLQDINGIDIFAYSIGAFLAEVALLSDKTSLFGDSKLFMFCGGGTFSSMTGESRAIIDKYAFKRLNSYYSTDFKIENSEYDCSATAFKSMIRDDFQKDFRLDFFKSNADRIAGILLKKDMVMSYKGVEEALGIEVAHQNVRLTDFDYDYSHEQPFPTNNPDNADLINRSFNLIFDEAAAFFRATVKP